MKHLLIILSILLLSSPEIGQETGVLYQYETSSGLVWKTFGNGKFQLDRNEATHERSFNQQELEFVRSKTFEFLKMIVGIRAV